jgi:hypothetical protein
MRCDRARQRVCPTFSIESDDPTAPPIDFWECPVRIVTARSRSALQLFQFYRNGFLWRGGGVAEQPYRYMEQMALIEQEVGRHEREEQEKLRRDAASRAGIRR